MKILAAALAVFAAALSLFLCSARPSARPVVSAGHSQSKDVLMPEHAKGTFEVKLTPRELGENAKSAGLGAFSIAKDFHGGLEGTSVAEMLTADSTVKGSGVYVAVERVTGTLGGRSGSFALYHSGVMARNVPNLSIRVVPDSGTGGLAGIDGVFEIIIADGKHSYDFAYTLPARE